jgi:hypothetical protein
LKDFESDIISKGYVVADCIGAVSEEEYKRKLGDYNTELEKSFTSTLDKIEELIDEKNDEIIREIDELNHKDSIRSFISQLQSNFEGGNFEGGNLKGGNGINSKMNFESTKKILSFLTKSSDSIVKMTFKEGASFLTKTTQASGSQMHAVVKGVGHFFGHKFVPWQAVKTAGQIGKVAQFVGPAFAIAGIGLDIRAAKKEEKAREINQKEKNKFIEGIRSYVKDLKSPVEQNFNTYLQNSYDVKIQEVADTQMQIIQSEEKNSKLTEHIKLLDSEYVDFIELINEE